MARRTPEPDDFFVSLHSGGHWVMAKPMSGFYSRTPVIAVTGDYREKEFMDSTCHETLHAIFPKLSETAVANAAEDLTTVLWAMGYRLAVRSKGE